MYGYYKATDNEIRQYLRLSSKETTKNYSQRDKSTTWFLQSERVKNTTQKLPKTVQRNLVNKSCFTIACFIIANGNLSPLYVQKIINELPTTDVVWLLWEFICHLGGDTCEMYFKFMVRFNNCYRATSLSINDVKPFNYRLEALYSTNFDILPTIKFLETSNSMAENFKFITVLEIKGNIKNVAYLPNLQTLTALSLSVPSLTSDINEIVRSWKQSLKSNQNRWNNLRFLSLPNLQNLTLFHDIFRLVQSLTAFEVNIKPDVIQQVPLLLKQYNHLNPRFESRTLFGKLRELEKYDNLDLSSSKIDKAVIDLRISTEQFHTIPKVSYEPLKEVPNKLEPSEILFTYSKKYNRDNPDNSNNDLKTSVKPRSNKKPKLVPIKRKIAKNGYFGMK